tara:strand:- start:6990 stop:7205 length:216 start_codon:yes stop_codon:yes gene_type:complete
MCFGHAIVYKCAARGQHAGRQLAHSPRRGAFCGKPSQLYGGYRSLANGSTTTLKVNPGEFAMNSEDFFVSE